MPRLSFGFVFIGLAGLLVGCGSDPPPVVVQPQQQPKKVGFAPKKKVVIEEPQGIDLSGEDPNTIFAMVENAPANFQTVAKVPPGKADDYFSVVDAGLPPTDRFVADNVPAAGAITNRLPNGFTAIAAAGGTEGWPNRILCKYDGTTLVLVPRGNAIIGSSIGPEESSPEATVFLDAFYISEREITVSLFERFRLHVQGRNDKVEAAMNFSSPADHPAVGITWRDARAYAKHAGCDLPTEAQWEMAARGPAGFDFPWGRSRPIWRSPRTLSQIDPVGFHPDDNSHCGALDMAGNAREWVLDFYRPDSFAELANIPPARKRNWAGPRTPSVSAQRVVKGNGPNWTLWRREGIRMTERVDGVGFRCVLNLAAANP